MSECFPYSETLFRLAVTERPIMNSQAVSLFEHGSHDAQPRGVSQSIAAQWAGYVQKYVAGEASCLPPGKAWHLCTPAHSRFRKLLVAAFSTFPLRVSPFDFEPELTQC
jgi:hypothetical protein